MYHLFSTTILNSSFEKAVNLFLQKILKVFMETSELLECFESDEMMKLVLTLTVFVGIKPYIYHQKLKYELTQ